MYTHIHVYYLIIDWVGTIFQTLISKFAIHVWHV